VPLRRAIAFSAGYLVRSVFHSGTAIGESQPLAQGVATSVSLFPAWSWWRMRPYASLSLEYARVVGRTEVEIGFPVSSTYQETVTGIGGALMAGVVVRPIRFIELGAGVGAGAIEHQKDGAASSPATWRPVARGLVSVAAVGLPLGLEVTAALTLDHRFGDPYDTQVIASFPAPTFAEERVDQPGGLITLGWRR
jgi:hypothetical protein